MSPPRCPLLVSCAVTLLFACTSLAAKADDREQAWKVIAAGMEAAGGAEKLKAANASTWNEVGTFYGMGEGLPYNGKMAVQWPHQFRMEIEGAFVVLLNGDKGWIIAGGESRSMTDDELAEQKENHFSGWLTTLVPLKDEAFKLKLLEEANIEGQPAAAVKVSHDEHRDVTLYFDKKTKLLIKSEQTVKAMTEDKLVKQEVYYRNYQDAGGVKTPMNIDMRRDGKKFVEAEIKDLEVSDKLDDAVFAPPKN